MDKGQIDEIRKRTSLQALVGGNVALQRRGRRYVGLCPFHKEKTPSFHVVEDEGFYYCFGCAERGDAFDWLQKTQGLSFSQALEQLARQAGVVLRRASETAQARNARTSGESLKEKQRERLLQVMEIATRFYQRELLTSTGAQARAYLRSRAIDKSIAQRFALGWADNDSRRFFEHMRQQGCSSSELLAAGLTVSNQQPTHSNPLASPHSSLQASPLASPRARFRSRIIFPIADRKGQTIAFGGRLLEPNNKNSEKSNSSAQFIAPKYLNSPETLLFSKGKNLYNFARARESARGAFAHKAKEHKAKEKAILVEGYMDVIALDKVGYNNSTASLGTALSEQQLALLWQLADEPILCFDGDRAGGQAAARAIKRALPLLNEDKTLRVFFLPDGEDPDSFVSKFGVQQWRQALEDAETVSEFLWRIEKAEREPIDSPEKLAQLDKALEQHSQSIVAHKLQKYYRAFFNDSLFRARRNLARINLRINLRSPNSSSSISARKIPFNNDEALRIRALQERLIIVLAKNPELWDRYEERFACIALPQDLDATRQAMLAAYAQAGPDEDVANILRQSGGEFLGNLVRTQYPYVQNGQSQEQVGQEIIDKILSALDYMEISKGLAQRQSMAEKQTIGWREDARRIFTQQ